MNPRWFLLISLVMLATFLVAALGQAQPPSLRDWRRLAGEMVDKEIAAAGVTNERVLKAVRETPRHEFVPANQRQFSYFDMALPIGDAQTISPPFIVAYMTQEIDPQPTDKVLEIGTGSGYQAAILSPLVQEVYSIEIVEALGKRAARTLQRLDYKNVKTKVGDGYLGWPEAAPFDKVIVTCSPEKVPQALVDQLREGGLMIIPVGERYQQTLYLFRKEKDELKSVALRPTLFVPMTGEAEAKRAKLPDPKNPQLTNGSFEEATAETDGTKQPSGWHYQRQLTLETDSPIAPAGKSFVTFHNNESGRSCQALQGFAVDGRAVNALALSFSVRGRDIRSGATQDQWPHVIITFYDERRATVGEESIGPFEETFDWRREKKSLRVPLKAREAILRIGLLGATGQLSLDDLQLQAQQ